MGVWMKGGYTPINPNKYRGDPNKIVYRSSWERAFMTFCDTTPDIKFWSSETEIVAYFDPVKNKQRKYFVDFRLVTKQSDGSLKTILIEIKPKKQTIKPRSNKNKSQKTMLSESTTYATNLAKWTAARAYCATKGWGFVIISEDVLFGGIDKGFKPPKRA
jgi:hypothetical protein